MVADEPRLWWELQYMGFPYGKWTRQEFDDENEAQAEFRRISEAEPPALNISMRSHRVEESD